MRERTKLGLWTCLPFLAWIVVWIAALSMPTPDCEGGGTASDAEAAVLIVAVAAASLGTAAAALWRLVGLGRAGAFSARRDLTLVGAVVATILVAIGLNPQFENVAVVALVLTGLAFVSLLVAWAAGLRLDQLGLLLPLYLLGAALFAYPLVGLIGLLASSGLGC